MTDISPSDQPSFHGHLLSIGYQLRSLDEFLERLVDADVDVVIDVRETAWSHKRRFSKKALGDALATHQIEYVHARFAGNPKALRRSAESHRDGLAAFEQYLDQRPEVMSELESLVSPLLESGKNVCFMCYERHPADCHRQILLERLLTRPDNQVSLHHIGPEGAPRFTDLQIDRAGFVS